jgi:hypothetical protein
MVRLHRVSSATSDASPIARGIAHLKFARKRQVTSEFPVPPDSAVPMAADDQCSRYRQILQLVLRGDDFVAILRD